MSESQPALQDMLTAMLPFRIFMHLQANSNQFTTRHTMIVRSNGHTHVNESRPRSCIFQITVVSVFHVVYSLLLNKMHCLFVLNSNSDTEIVSKYSVMFLITTFSSHLMNWQLIWFNTFSFSFSDASTHSLVNFDTFVTEANWGTVKLY